MLNFYKKAAAVFLILLLLTLLAAYVCVSRTFLGTALLPQHKNSSLPWTLSTLSDVVEGGSSSISINESTYTVDYSYLITRNFEFPYASVRFDFNDYLVDNRYIDLSSYSTLSFNVRCSPHNVVAFLIYTFDEKVTPQHAETMHRLASTFFSCEDKWQRVEIDLAHLEVPAWWLDLHKMELSNRSYSLDQVAGFAFGTSSQSPVDVVSNVKLSELVLQGRDWRYMYAFAAFALLLWSGYLFWFFRLHTVSLIADIKDKMQKDRPLVAYQQLSIEPQRDKDRKLILSYMATEYSDADLSLDTMVTKLGVSRTKINDILKEEMGYTFTAYLNKLRLTEAARLLAEKGEANIAEIAYSVGYKNVPYFNKLFKIEYGCTPKTFKNVYKH